MPSVNASRLLKKNRIGAEYRLGLVQSTGKCLVRVAQELQTPIKNSTILEKNLKSPAPYALTRPKKINHTTSRHIYSGETASLRRWESI
jgi:hypothetical protein